VGGTQAEGFPKKMVLINIFRPKRGEVTEE